MIRRCEMPSQDSYPLYGGRGIKVCARWRTFENFLADMGEKPDGLSLERMDPNGHYEPGNCRWATAKEQARNTRRSRRLTHDGTCMTVAEWSEKTGIPDTMIRSRIDKLGWAVDRALTTPPVPREESIARAAAATRCAPIEEYVEALRKGESTASIGARYGISGCAVRNALRRAGLSAASFTQTTAARRTRALAG